MPNLNHFVAAAAVLIAVSLPVRADDPAPVAPAHCLGSKSACAPACPTAPCNAPAATPKIEVIMSQPEVRVVAPSHCAGDKCKEGGSCEKGSCGHEKGKCFSLLNINCAKSKGPAAGGQETVTTVVPAYATATIPIALQTTRTFTASGEFAAVARREAAFTRADVRDAVRDALAESARQRGTGGQESATTQSDCCTELKARVEKVEKKLEELSQTVDRINQKLGGGK